jgi:glutamine synthetase adenylyltransferase
MTTDTTGAAATGQDGGQEQVQGAGITPEFMEALRSKLSAQDQEIHGLRSQAKTLEQLKSALTGDKQEGPKGKWIDPILQHALEAEKRGQPMPITTEIAVAVQKLTDQLEEYEARNRKQEEALKRVTDPQAWQDQQMFASMDDQLQRLVNQLYPGVDNRAQYDAMVQRCTKYLNELGEDPQIWREFRNNKTAQARLIQYVAQQFVPPKALNQMRDEYERKSPYTKEQLQEAWEEAKTIPDEKKRSEVMAKLRHTIIGLNLQKRMKTSR